jgi:two-component system response regulator TctD
LTPREHAVLEALILRAKKTVAKALLADSLSNADTATSEDAIEIYVSRLRKKLEKSTATIITLRGLGYLLEDGADDE